MYDGDNSNLVLEQAHVLYCLRMVWLCMDMPTYIYIFTAIFETPNLCQWWKACCKTSTSL